jgi:CRP/FNR family transcriptional regulator, cyclic AMP receptor protein
MTTASDRTVKARLRTWSGEAGGDEAESVESSGAGDSAAVIRNAEQASYRGTRGFASVPEPAILGKMSILSTRPPAQSPDGTLETLAASARSLAFKKGARIFEEGSLADCCFVLTAGKAHIVLAGSRGAEILLNIVTPPALIGEISLLDRSTRTASFVAAEPCQVIRIPAAALDALRRNPAFEQRLVAGLVSTVRESDDRVRAISSFPSVSRVAWCLLRIASHAGRRDGSSIVIPKARHIELAEMAGCSRETVSRALQVLKRKIATDIAEEHVEDLHARAEVADHVVVHTRPSINAMDDR